MAASKSVPLALMTMVERRYGTCRLVTRVVRPTDGELLNPQWHYGFDPDSMYADLEISAYLGDLEFMGHAEVNHRVWGNGLRVNPSGGGIESAGHAASIAKVLRKLETGLAKLSEAEGFLADGEYAAYVLRIGRILGIKTHYVRNNSRALANSGERYRIVSGSGLQYYVSDALSTLKDGRIAEYVG